MQRFIPYVQMHEFEGAACLASPLTFADAY